MPRNAKPGGTRIRAAESSAISAGRIGRIIRAAESAAILAGLREAVTSLPADYRVGYDIAVAYVASWDRLNQERLADADEGAQS